MKVLKTLAIAPAIALVGSASAQISTKPISLNVGWNYLPGSSASGATSPSDGYIVGLGYHFSPHGLGLPTWLDTSLEASWSENMGNRNRLSTWGVFAEARAPFETSAMGGKHGMVPYYGLGVGIVDNQFQGDNNHTVVTTSDAALGHFDPFAIGSSAGSAANCTFGAKAFLGVMFDETYFLEAAYNYNGTVGGSEVDSISVSVGIRF